MNSTSPDINIFAQTDFRNLNKRFGIKTDDRRRHMYIIGKTGMGKSTLLENMVLHDMWAGHGIGLIDPHGELAEKMINFVPPHRVKDVVYFNPADIENPLGFNILESVSPDKRHLVSSGLMGVFKKIWPDVWSARMEYILNNTILALLECNNTTLLSINRLLADKNYRSNIVRRLTDPVVKAFWVNEFDKYQDKYKQEAVAPIQNKIGQFLSAAIIRNIVSQQRSTFDVRAIMDNQKIFIVDLSKGRIGEDASRLLGGMLITKIQLSAMERVDIPEVDRKDFFLYVDEFQNFATESFANILSEARKYRLGLIMAHQYVKQLDEKVADAVFGNVGTMIAFRIGAEDAEMIEKEFEPTFMKDDIVNLPKFHVYLKLLIDGVSSKPFSAGILPPVSGQTNSTAAVLQYSREHYATPRAAVEERIRDWSMGTGEEDFRDMNVGDAAVIASMEGRPNPPSATSYSSSSEPVEDKPKKENKNLPPPEDWFAAKCDRCGADTTVPFKPDGHRKIYCKDCYKYRNEEEELNKTKPAVLATPIENSPVSNNPSPTVVTETNTNQDINKKKRKRKRKKGGSGGFNGLAYDNNTKHNPSQNN